MGAGRRTEAHLGPHFPSAGSPASSSSSAQFLNLPVGELVSVIFGCTHATYDECVNQLLFGLPRQHYSYIKNVYPGMTVFLFNYSDRKLHGIFEADGCGDLDIEPRAWTGGKHKKTQFSAQVRVKVRRLCSPLSEKVFKEAIAANYYKDSQNHFSFELNRVQTDVLLSLFARNTPYMSSPAGASAWPQGGGDEGWVKLKKTPKSAIEAWHNAEAFVPAPAQMSPAQSEGRAYTQEHWDGGPDKVEDETTTRNGEDAVNRCLERAAENSLDRRGTVKLLSGESSEDEADRRKEERAIEVFEKLRQLKQRAEVPRVRDESQEEASGSSSVESTKVQDSARVERERLTRERSSQEQTMLREERELLIEKFQALDVPVAKAIDKNLEIFASAIAEMRQDQIKLRHVMDEALNQLELLRELEDQFRKKTTVLEDTQVQTASETEQLKSDVSRLSQQLQTHDILIKGLFRGM